MFNGKIHYKWPFSIAMLVHQRVSHLTMDLITINPTVHRLVLAISIVSWPMCTPRSDPGHSQYAGITGPIKGGVPKMGVPQN